MLAGAPPGTRGGKAQGMGATRHSECVFDERSLPQCSVTDADAGTVYRYLLSVPKKAVPFSRARTAVHPAGHRSGCRTAVPGPTHPGPAAVTWDGTNFDRRRRRYIGRHRGSRCSTRTCPVLAGYVVLGASSSNTRHDLLYCSALYVAAPGAKAPCRRAALCSPVPSAQP